MNKKHQKVLNWIYRNFGIKNDGTKNFALKTLTKLTNRGRAMK